ncbi:N-acetylmuramate alpha-1-phosphate uridylyltransferase MurU [Piscinibacter koreensis]|uniref:Nucleotidyltransferase family protein n=1 Tax=Piscinibacter koreensis TaxID=2742824 RepID=A0A7Y6NKA5_9BURK|nr:nucleotidyltransferase family protein [Schlegelella koreensis]NUZ04687.1 nucleotidyltransferase family protein [Schlegelella koreensis]
MTLKAMILAAGRGERMRPLTDHVPKPLLEVHGRPLIEHHLVALAAAGVRDVVVNTAWLEQQIVDRLGDGRRFGLASIAYSMEGRDHGGALETAGGIATAGHLLGEAFWLVSADVYVPDFGFDAGAAARFVASDRLAHLWLVPNPSFHPRGDFGIDADGFGIADGAGPDGERWTYANLALIRGELCAGVAPGQHAKLGPLLAAAMRDRRVSVEIYRGRWHNLGTPEQLAALNAPADAR